MNDLSYNTSSILNRPELQAPDACGASGRKKELAAMTRVCIACGILLSLLLTAPAARGDTVILTNGLKYSPVTLTNADADQLSFRYGDRSLSIPLARVARLEIDGAAAFNEAERLMAEGEFPLAAGTYALAAEQTGPPWRKGLIEYRRQQALKQATAAAPAPEAATQPASAPTSQPAEPTVLDSPSDLVTLLKQGPRPPQADPDTWDPLTPTEQMQAMQDYLKELESRSASARSSVRVGPAGRAWPYIDTM
jgi:hypothetical protein